MTASKKNKKQGWRSKDQFPGWVTDLEKPGAREQRRAAKKKKAKDA